MRRLAVAGTWYPRGVDELAAAVDRYLAAAGEPLVPEAVTALVAPHAGLIYSGPVAAFAYATLRRQYRAVVLVGPSHFVPFEGVSIWPAGAWESPYGPIPIAEPLAAALMRASPLIREVPAAHAREHALEMQLPFLARRLPGVPIVPLVVGHQTRATAEALTAALVDALHDSSRTRDGDVLLVASSDLSHYQDARVAARLDRAVITRVERLDPEGLMDLLEREPHHACGGVPMVSVLSAAQRLGGTSARALHYADSGDVSGDKSSVVGYLAAAVW
jgi:hypothetical protein